jgi:heat shock protein HslJ
MSDRHHRPALPAMHRFGLMAAAVLAALAGALPSVNAQGRSFPFDHEMHLDANPIRGSKRVPILQIARNGDVEIDLWCVSGTGKAVIADTSITIVPTAMRDNQCPEERLLMDKTLLDQLTQVTSWRWEGQMLVLVGPQPLRYRPASN